MLSAIDHLAGIDPVTGTAVRALPVHDTEAA